MDSTLYGSKANNYGQCGNHSLSITTISFAGMSLITNMVILEHDSDKEPPNHKEVMDTADQRARDMRKLVKCVIEKLSTLPQ